MSNKEKTVKVKVIKSSHPIYDLYHDYSCQVLFPVVTDWEEVTMTEARKIQDAVNQANRQIKTNDLVYVYLEYACENGFDEIFEKASEFQKAIERKQKKIEEKREQERLKKEERAQERKRKQLEKLKQELGEE